MVNASSGITIINLMKNSGKICLPWILRSTGCSGLGSWHGNGANMIFCYDHVQFALQSWWLADTAASKCLWNNDNQSHPEFQ